MLISFEGGDRVGKSTQIRLLADALMEQGHRVVVTMEPGGTPLGRALREILLHDRTLPPPTPIAELLLMAADRAEHVERVIKPALARGDIVITDRFSDSTVAYQGYGLGLPLAQIEQVNRIATQGLQPDLTIVLDLPVQARAERQRENEPWDRIDRRTADFHQRVRRGFLQLAADHPQRVAVIDASASKETIHAQIVALIKERLLPGLRLESNPEEERT